MTQIFVLFPFLMNSSKETKGYMLIFRNRIGWKYSLFRFLISHLGVLLAPNKHKSGLGGPTVNLHGVLGIKFIVMFNVQI